MRRGAAAFSCLVVGGALLLPMSPATAAPWSAPVPGWTVNLDTFDVNQPIAQSSPVLATMQAANGKLVKAIVVGDRSGHLYALNQATGGAVSKGGRAIASPGIPIDSTASTANVSGEPTSTIFIGLGNRSYSCNGPHGYGGTLALKGDGSLRWYGLGQNPPTDTDCAHSAVMSSPVVASLQGQLAVTAMSLGQGQMAFNAKTGAPLSGWNPWYQADSSVSTPAVARLDGPTSPVSVIEGGDSTFGISYGQWYHDGGHVRIIANNGNGGVAGPGGTRCSFDFYGQYAQIIESSPAVGAFLRGGGTGIATGAGYFSGTGPEGSYNGPTNQVTVMDSSCHLIWQASTDYETSSPILADVNGDGKLDVVVGTQDVSQPQTAQPRNGSVYAYDGATGRLLWRTQVGSVLGSPVAADLRNTGHADVVVTTASADSDRGGLVVLDGASGRQLWATHDTAGQNSPLLTAEADGSIGITIAGYQAELGGTGNACQGSGNICLAGLVRHYRIPGSSAAWLNRPLTTWSQFHHDVRLTGNVAGPVP